jgi:hypothetical protein
MRYVYGCLLSFCVIGAFSNHISAQIQHTPRSKVVWAKKATAFVCLRGGQTIMAPDHLTSVQLTCESDLPFVLQVIAADGHRQEVGLRFGANELLWAPNSRSFFVDGGENSYAGFFVDVYRFEDSGRVVSPPITEAAFRDMVNSFPPCKALNRHEMECSEMARNPEYYNMSAVEWSTDSSAIYVFAEVPCNNRYGGIMCQVLGYELSVPDGRILKRISAREAKQQWGKYAAWKIRIPEPPEYESPFPREKSVIHQLPSSQHRWKLARTVLSISSVGSLSLAEAG